MMIVYEAKVDSVASAAGAEAASSVCAAVGQLGVVMVAEAAAHHGGGGGQARRPANILFKKILFIFVAGLSSITSLRCCNNLKQSLQLLS